jgi:hypothetical protein
MAGVSSDGRTVAIVDMGDVVSLHRVEAAALIAQACGRRPQPLPDGLRQLVPGWFAATDICGRPLGPAGATAPASGTR